jgi:ferric enterobactin receptor
MGVLSFLTAQKFKEHTAQVDFVTPVNKVTVEAGLKAIFRNNSSDFSYRPLNDSTGQYQPDAAQSNSFTNTQNVFSAYNSYQLALSSWNINAGVRVEKTVIRANFMSTASVAGQNYFNVVPSISVSKRFKDESSINFGFSQRIRRPGINRLNPYVDRSNPNYEVTGSPNLRPVLLNDIQFGYGSNKKLSVNIGVDYSFMNNLDLQVVNFDQTTQVTQITYANTGKASSAGINFNLSYPVTKIYNASLNGNMMYLWLQGQADGKIVDNNLLMYGVTLSNVVRLNHGWALNADLGVNSRNPTGLQGTTNGFFYSAVNFNKDIVKNKFSVSGGIKNPFTKYRNSISKTFGPQFNQTYQSMNYYRSFSVSLNYNFGGLKDRINKNRVGIENNDVAN